jgi:hypothetical protein
LASGWVIIINCYHEKDIGVDIMRTWMGDIDSPAAGPLLNNRIGRSIFLGDRMKGAQTAHLGFLRSRLRF